MPEETKPKAETPLMARVKLARELSGLSARTLSKRAGVSHSVVGQAEHGQIEPLAETLEAIAAAAGVDPQWLRFGDGSPRSGLAVAPASMSARAFDYDATFEPYETSNDTFRAFANGRLLVAKDELERRQFREALSWAEKKMPGFGVAGYAADYERDEMEWGFAMGLHIVRGDQKPSPLRSEILTDQKVDTSDGAVVETHAASSAKFVAVPKKERRTSRVSPADDEAQGPPAQSGARLSKGTTQQGTADAKRTR